MSLHTEWTDGGQQWDKKNIKNGNKFLEITLKEEL